MTAPAEICRRRRTPHNHGVLPPTRYSDPARRGRLDGETRDPLDAALAKLPRRPGRHPIVAVLHADNDPARIRLTLDSLAGQQRRPDLIVVSPDECTDAIADAVLSYRDTVILTAAGDGNPSVVALNHALDQLLPRLNDEDAILVVEAGSVLHPDFLRVAAEQVHSMPSGAKRPVGAVRGRVRGSVLGGRHAAALYEVRALLHVTDARATGELPGGAPQVYDPAVPAADSELTLALLTLGYSVPGPRQCQVETGVTTTWLDAFGQRLRRKQAALTALIRYVPTAITWRYWARQFVTQAGALVAAVSIAGVACVRILPATAQVHPMWLLASALCAVPQLCTAGERGPLRFLLAVTVVVEMLFAALVEAKPSAKGRCTR